MKVDTIGSLKFLYPSYREQNKKKESPFYTNVAFVTWRTKSWTDPIFAGSLLLTGDGAEQ